MLREIENINETFALTDRFGRTPERATYRTRYEWIRKATANGSTARTTRTMNGRSIIVVVSSFLDTIFCLAETKNVVFANRNNDKRRFSVEVFILYEALEPRQFEQHVLDPSDALVSLLTVCPYGRATFRGITVKREHSFEKNFKFVAQKMPFVLKNFTFTVHKIDWSAANVFWRLSKWQTVLIDASASNNERALNNLFVVKTNISSNTFAIVDPSLFNEIVDHPAKWENRIPLVPTSVNVLFQDRILLDTGHLLIATADTGAKRATRTYEPDSKQRNTIGNDNSSISRTVRSSNVIVDDDLLLRPYRFAYVKNLQTEVQDTIIGFQALIDRENGQVHLSPSTKLITNKLERVKTVSLASYADLIASPLNDQRHGERRCAIM